YVSPSNDSKSLFPDEIRKPSPAAQLETSDRRGNRSNISRRWLKMSQGPGSVLRARKPIGLEDRGRSRLERHFKLIEPPADSRHCRLEKGFLARPALKESQFLFARFQFEQGAGLAWREEPLGDSLHLLDRTQLLDIHSNRKCSGQTNQDDLSAMCHIKV